MSAAAQSLEQKNGDETMQPKRAKPKRGIPKDEPAAGMVVPPRLAAAMKAYGTALFTFYQYWKLYELEGFPPSLEDMQSSPDLYDGIAERDNYTEHLIAVYFTMMQACRDLDRGYAVEGEPIDKLIDAFEAWVATD